MEQSEAIDMVAQRAKELGFNGVSPESLSAVEYDGTKNGWTSPRVRAAFYITMAGFAQMLEPLNGWPTNN